jgi:peptidyl-prolyl cis-trans isomerase-like 4
LDDPFEDPPHLPVPSRSPSPSLKLVQITDKIALDEKEDDDEGKTAEEIKKEMEEKEAKAQAQILEMVGDLHYADEKPPDNVLFVCKLNPVTTSEDLEIIFSRFGTIVECEVIKDRRTQQSLQYAFIEFETPEQCEAAYLKMDNVLIDDRRISVDFSQSVAKNFQWKKQVKGDKRRSQSPPPKKSRKRSKSPDERKGRRRSRSRDRNRSREKKRRSPSPDRRRRHYSDSEDENRSKHHGSRDRHRHGRR